MKFFTFAVAALASFASLASAAPVPVTVPVEAIEARGELAARAPPKVPTPQEFINTGLIKAPRRDKAFFWTGVQNQVGDARRLRSVALDVAAKNGFDIVGEMLSDAALRLINGPKAPVTQLKAADAVKFVEQFWDNASAAFAELTTGQVTVMMEGDPSTGPQPEASSVFQRIERPILEERASFGVQAVTGVDRIGRDFQTTKLRVPFQV
ncbi:hypothetical protein MIND_00396200 [Mycena indigotica]|uniref:Uncharacterized protein n=1 Tax=Mycena indigotica TaxID=2126181 RepID=A0A8H6T6B4_9AGAR|nr:uncharacterized protein MIND_00396200 [Mycena indigotica]KAF7310225.1 hypothetical protein MIND_00396200 [Mycena indigotica]